MSTVSRASKAVVAASVGVVEALKDQAGICRWNSPTLRSAHQQAKKHFRSYSQANKSKLSSSSTSALSRVRNEKLKKSEESLRTVIPKEFRRNFLGLKKKGRLRRLWLPAAVNKALILPTNDLPTEFDWREKSAESTRVVPRLRSSAILYVEDNLALWRRAED
ncbi:hypothetical protein ACLB2K_067567 [Fragaria x ananassa]